MRRGAHTPEPGMASSDACRLARTVHSPSSDMQDDATAINGQPSVACCVDLGGARTLSVVPLRKDGALLGVIHDLPPGGAAVHRQADRTAGEFRRPGGDRDGERAAADRDSARRWSSRPRPPRCCRSSMPRPAISRRCSMRCWKRRRGCARRAFGDSATYDGERFRIVAHARRARRVSRSCCASRHAAGTGSASARSSLASSSSTLPTSRTTELYRAGDRRSPRSWSISAARARC